MDGLLSGFAFELASEGLIGSHRLAEQVKPEVFTVGRDVPTVPAVGRAEELRFFGGDVPISIHDPFGLRSVRLAPNADALAGFQGWQAIKGQCPPTRVISCKGVQLDPVGFREYFG